MTTVKQAAQLAAFSRRPTTLVKLTVRGDVAGSQVFRFSPKDGPPISLQIGQDARAYLVSVDGRPGRLRPEAALTERARITMVFGDDGNAPPFSSSVFTVTTGGTFWRRLLVAQPNIVGSTVEVLRGFISDGFAESDFERIFIGRLEQIDFQPDARVKLVAKDILALEDRSVPAEISDNNLLDGAITASSTSITIDNGDEVTDPADLASKDFFPVILRLEPGGGSEEDVIIGSKSGDTFTVQQNLTDKSEDFTHATWVKSSGTTVTANQFISAFGGPLKGDLVVFDASSDYIEQDTGIAASGNTFVFSVWIRRGRDAQTGDKVRVELRLSDDTEAAFTEAVLTANGWSRVQVSTAFTGGAGQTAKIRVYPAVTGGAPDVALFGAQLEQGSTARGFYVGTDGNDGTDAGRGAFGSTAVTHADDSEFKETVLYRQHLANEGISPVIALRDLVNRGGIDDDDVDESVFVSELEFLSRSEVRRSGVTAIDKPRKLSEHVKELRGQSLLDLWIGEDGLVKTRFSFRPNQIGSTKALSDENNIIHRSSNYRGNPESRVTRALVYYTLIAGEEGNKPEDFSNIQVVVDLAVEDLSGPRTKAVFSKWLYRQSEAIALAGRIVSRFKRGARRGRWKLDLKDAPDFDVGDNIGLDSIDVLIKSGSAAVRGSTFWQVVMKEEKREDGQVQVEGLEASGLKYAIIGPSALPDFGTATDADKQYGYIGDSNNKVDSGNLDGYYIL